MAPTGWLMLCWWRVWKASIHLHVDLRFPFLALRFALFIVFHKGFHDDPPGIVFPRVKLLPIHGAEICAGFLPKLCFGAVGQPAEFAYEST